MKKAFTLIELLIVIGVIAILTVAFLPNALNAPAKARDAGRIKTVNDVAAALETYRSGGRALPGPLGGNCLAKDAQNAGIPDAFVGMFQNNALPFATLQSCSLGSGANAHVVPGAGKFPLFYYKFPNAGYVVGELLENAGSGNYLVKPQAGNTGAEPGAALLAVVGAANTDTSLELKSSIEAQKTNPPADATKGYFIIVGD